MLASWTYPALEHERWAVGVRESAYEFEDSHISHRPAGTGAKANGDVRRVSRLKSEVKEV